MGKCGRKCSGNVIEKKYANNNCPVYLRLGYWHHWGKYFWPLARNLSLYGISCSSIRLTFESSEKILSIYRVTQKLMLIQLSKKVNITWDISRTSFFNCARSVEWKENHRFSLPYSFLVSLNGKLRQKERGELKKNPKVCSAQSKSQGR